MTSRLDWETVLSSQPIRELLESCPAASKVFIRHRMACVGCDFSGFHSPAEAASIYGMHDGRFLRDLHKFIDDSDRD